VGALERGSDPGYADFKTPVLPLDVVMARPRRQMKAVIWSLQPEGLQPER